MFCHRSICTHPSETKRAAFSSGGRDHNAQTAGRLLHAGARTVIAGGQIHLGQGDQDFGAGLEIGQRVFHQKFGYGRVAAVDGNKLTVDFEKAGRKKVVDTFVERV